MKSVFVTRNQPFSRYVRLAVLPLLAFVFSLASCQKESTPAFDLRDKVAVSTPVNARTTSVEGDVLEHTQWVIDNMLPLAFDADVCAALSSGNTGSAVVSAKLAALGYSSFEQFSEAYRASGSSVMSAIQAGNLSGTAIQQLVAGHVFDLGTLDDGDSASAALPPCTQQFQSDLAMLPLVLLAASETGPGSGLAGVVYVITAYVNFNNCLRATYPNG
ncbi:MAG: hypothetical protein IPM98_21805 [Lewinellaceae bacterium]|nr:hypothetical protein [Lewinellaceae bacterium]